MESLKKIRSHQSKITPPTKNKKNLNLNGEKKSTDDDTEIIEMSELPHQTFKQ